MASPPLPPPSETNQLDVAALNRQSHAASLVAPITMASPPLIAPSETSQLEDVAAYAPPTTATSPSMYTAASALTAAAASAISTAATSPSKSATASAMTSAAATALPTVATSSTINMATSSSETTAACVMTAAAAAAPANAGLTSSSKTGPAIAVSSVPQQLASVATLGSTSHNSQLVNRSALPAAAPSTPGAFAASAAVDESVRAPKPFASPCTRSADAATEVQGHHTEPSPAVDGRLVSRPRLQGANGDVGMPGPPQSDDSAAPDVSVAAPPDADPGSSALAGSLPCVKSDAADGTAAAPSADSERSRKQKAMLAVLFGS